MADEIAVKMSLTEVGIAAHLGVLVRLYDLEKDFGEKHGAGPHRAWDYTIYGALGEMAVAKHFNQYWYNHIGDFTCLDVGIYEVRWTQPHRQLFLRGNEGKVKLDVPYILTTDYGLPWVWLMAWAWGHELASYPVEDKWNNGREAHWMPLRDMRPMSTIPTGIRENVRAV